MAEISTLASSGSRANTRGYAVITSARRDGNKVALQRHRAAPSACAALRQAPGTIAEPRRGPAKPVKSNLFLPVPLFFTGL